MKKASLFFIVLMFVSVMGAAVFKTGENIFIPKDEVIEQNLVLAGKSITIQGDVLGDIIAAGEYINLLGKVKGDVMLFGSHIQILSPSLYDIRAVGMDIFVKTKAIGDIFLAGEHVKVGDATTVFNDLIVYGSRLDIAGKVKGNAKLSGQKVKLKKDMIIQGDLSTSSWDSTESCSKQKGLESSPDDHLFKQIGNKIDILLKKLLIIGHWSSIVSLLIIGLLISIFFPKYIREVNMTISETPVKSIGVGILFLIVTPIIIFLCMVSILGIPLGLLLLFIYSMSIYTTKVFLSFWIGTKVIERLKIKKDLHLFFNLVIGFIIYSLVLKLPFLGFVVGALGLFLGLGAVILSKVALIKRAREKNIF